MDKRKKRPMRVFINPRYLAWLLREAVERYQTESTAGSILVVDDEVTLLHVLKDG
ncbi:MAG: hypothetical protein JRJ77_16690, partial [Deltaproteobacteria bacterium]|nr:hypothetical protein [Deltaproteobacteria bacterium]